MFTIPVGNFNRAAVGYRPTANSVATTPIGSVTSPQLAYDTDPSTYATMSSGLAGTTTTIYSGFASVITSSAVLNLNLTGQVYNAPTNSISVDISYNGGSSYDFIVPLDWVTAGLWNNTTGIFTPSLRNIFVSIPDGINMASIKIRFNTGVSTSCGFIVYDIVINQ